jgi:hypothetical protein
MAIISDLVKQDAPASLRCAPGLGEGKKETLGFFAHLSLFKPKDVSAFVTKATHAFC